MGCEYLQELGTAREKTNIRRAARAVTNPVSDKRYISATVRARARNKNIANLLSKETSYSRYHRP